MSVLDNAKYKEMVLAPGEHCPDLGYDYPVDDPLFRMRPVEKVRDYKNDDTYPYLNDSLKFKITSTVVYAIIVKVILNLVCRLKHGLKVKGKENLKKHKDLIDKGIVTVSNHCFPLDAVCIHLAVGRRLWIPMLADLFTSKDWWLLTYFGGIPLTDGTLSATRKFNAAFDEHHRRQEVVHIFPEARSWPYYKPLRPFRKGAFTMAYRWGCPVIPISLSYRPRTGIYRLFGKANTPLITVNVGEPIYPDTTLPRKEGVDRLMRDTHEAICAMGGIIKNPWPAVAND